MKVLVAWLMYWAVVGCATVGQHLDPDIRYLLPRDLFALSGHEKGKKEKAVSIHWQNRGLFYRHFCVLPHLKNQPEVTCRQSIATHTEEMISRNSAEEE